MKLWKVFCTQGLTKIGCDYVIHTASPFIRNVDNPQEDLVDPAVNGTLNILNSCSKEESVRRLIVTSSVGKNINSSLNF